MKSKILFAIAFSILFFACTKTDPNLVKITGKVTNPLEDKVHFDNSIAPLLGDTSYSTILNKEGAQNKAPLSQIKVLSFKEKDEWDLQAKYNIGKKAEDGDTEV